MKNGLHIDFEGTKRWYLNNLLHREDGPAVVYKDGEKAWCINGKLHREGGPALIYSFGTRYWYTNGELNREDGPAGEHSNGHKKWFLLGYPCGISKNKSGIEIGCEVKPTVADWDEWFAGDEEFVHKRDSPEFQVLLKLWDQFKRQCEDLKC